MSPSTEQNHATAERRYETPVLRVFGTVASVTATTSMTGVQKDGGPNNIKT
jgi:hypothetical protein